jgi:hypothetical protein
LERILTLTAGLNSSPTSSRIISRAIRRNQTQSDAIRRNQTQSDAGNQRRSEAL